MAHHIYTTEALVVEGVHSGEANKSFLLFTAELGMIRAHAQGVRLLKSKLRFSLQEYAYVSVSVVRGKELWRVTSARLLHHPHKENNEKKKEAEQAIARICLILKRLMPQEEKHEQLLSYIVDAFDFLKQEKIPEKEQVVEDIQETTKIKRETEGEAIKNLECLVVLNILHDFGYLGNIIELKEFVHAPLSADVLEKLGKVRKIAYGEINRSLQETQL